MKGTLMKPQTVEMVLCDMCGTAHRVDSNFYIQVAGNIYMGKNGGLVGNNLDDQSLDNPKVMRSSIYCKKCFLEYATDFCTKY
jgi:hypothetical protein